VRRLREDGGFTLTVEAVLLMIVSVVIITAVGPVIIRELTSFTERVADSILEE